MAFCLDFDSFLCSVDPEDIVKKGQALISSAFSQDEMSDEELLKANNQMRLGQAMKFVGTEIQSWEGQRSAMIFCNAKLDNLPPDYAENVLEPAYKYIIRTSGDQDLVDSALFALATLHLRGDLFEGLSVEERYRLPTEQTVAIADMIIEKVSEDKVYDQWTRLVREPWMKRRERRDC